MQQLYMESFCKRWSCVLQEPRQKIIDIETCIQMLSIVMTNQAHLQPFIDFLQHQTEYKFINNDQWMGFYRFSLEVDCLCLPMKTTQLQEAMWAASA